MKKKEIRKIVRLTVEELLPAYVVEEIDEIAEKISRNLIEGVD